MTDNIKSSHLEPKFNYNITWLDGEKYKDLEDLEELLEQEEFEDRIKFIEKSVAESKKTPFLKRVKAKIGKIDASRAAFDLVFTWRTLNAKCEEVVNEAKVKWQPHEKEAALWDSLESQAITHTVSIGIESAKLHEYLKLPPMPWRYSDDFYRALGINETEAKLISRVEIRALEDRVVLVIYDRAKYVQGRSMFWEVDGMCDEKESTLRIDLEKLRAEFSEIADSKDSPAAQRAMYALLRSQASSKTCITTGRSHWRRSDKELVDEIAALELHDAESELKQDQDDDTTF